MRVIGLLILVAVVAGLAWTLVAIFRGASERDRQGTKGTFWPQSPVGQIGAVVLIAVAVLFFGGMVSAAL